MSDLLRRPHGFHSISDLPLASGSAYNVIVIMRASYN